MTAVLEKAKFTYDARVNPSGIANEHFPGLEGEISLYQFTIAAPNLRAMLDMISRSMLQEMFEASDGGTSNTTVVFIVVARNGDTALISVRYEPWHALLRRRAQVLEGLLYDTREKRFWNMEWV